MNSPATIAEGVVDDVENRSADLLTIGPDDQIG